MALLSGAEGTPGAPSAAESLLPSGRHLDVRLLPRPAVDVQMLFLDSGLSGLRDVSSIGLVAGHLLQLVVPRGRFGRERVVLGVHQPNALRRGPDQRVDLVQLPGLVPPEQRRPM